MKIMIASDIHGSVFYLKQLMKDMKREAPDRLLLLGDLLYHGPRNDIPKDYSPREAAEILNSVQDRIICIRGNCDADVDQMLLKFPITAQNCILYAGDRMIFATHGDKYNMSSLPPMHRGDILLHGHTHLQAWEPFGEDNYYFNPGSVSIPFGSSRHAYMIITEQEAVWKQLGGEPFHTFRL